MEITETLYVKTREEWRTWLQVNYSSEQEIWLIYYKKHTGKARIPYGDAVEEALCYGWIDSIVKRVDDEIYVQKFSPRKPRSVWSVLNKDRVEKMIKAGSMTPAGLVKVEEAKKNGKWEEAYSRKEDVEIPQDLSNALEADRNANKNFVNFANSYKKMYVNWVNAAKKEETRQRRILKVVERASRNLKPGMM
ncbi:MAG: YdeI/OmpD-associated family protein [Bacteroidales bacterium]|nr:YdeI/OmpD-associated family protein [Bacteroidales bacterium]